MGNGILFGREGGGRRRGGPRIAWERADIAFRGAATYEATKRVRRARFRDGSQSTQAIIELDRIGESGRVGRLATVADRFRFYFSSAVEGIRLCILPADHRHDHSECCPP